MSANFKKSQDKDKKFSFIQEQIVPKKAPRTRKFMAVFLMTIFLAVVFGLVARYVFCVSGTLFANLLPEVKKKDIITFPNNEPNENGQGGKDDKNGNGTTNPEGENDKTIVIENTVEAEVSDFVMMYSKINEIAADVNQSIVTVISAEKSVDLFNNDYELKNTTSGVVIAKDSSYMYILTSNDQFNKAKNTRIIFNDNLSLPGNYHGGDSELNLAIVTVEISELPNTTLKNTKIAKLGESYLLTTGEPVMLLGNPNGYLYSMELGIIASKSTSAYTIDNRIDLIHTDMEDNPNGEGIVVNMKGEIVGIITQKFKYNLDKNINTGIAISRIKPVIEKLVNSEPIPYLGIIGADLAGDIAKGYNISSGIYITEVKSKSPAFDAGLKNGDIILSIGEKNTISVISLNNYLQIYKPDETVELTIIRTTQDSGGEIKVNVKLGKK